MDFYKPPQTASRIEELKAKTPDLSRSDFFRNKQSYQDFRELINEREKTSVLVIGLGRLEEPLGYLSTYYNNKQSFLGLDATLVDIQEKKEFQQLIDSDSMYFLGRNIQGEPRSPIDCTQDAFKITPSGEFVAKDVIKEKLSEIVEEHGYYEISIQDESDIIKSGITKQKYDFVSANNVLQYIDKQNLESVLDSLVELVENEGLISLRTEESETIKIINLHMRQFHGEFERIGKGRYKKNRK